MEDQPHSDDESYLEDQEEGSEVQQDDDEL